MDNRLPPDITAVIKAAVARNASDLHIKAGDVFRARIDGELKPLTKQRLTPEQTKGIAVRLMPVEEDRKRIDAIKDYDCSWGAAGIGRFRVSILRQRSSFMIVMRVIPFEVPTLSRLGLPDVVGTIAESERGLVLVTGMTGCGKTSTMAAMINHINTVSNKHIVTLENPIEYLHRDVRSSVTQREVGPDTDSYFGGMGSALRQDPDVILVGEIRDVDTMETCIKAAEVGHLVISAMYTPDATSTIARLVAMFPPEAQEVARTRLADSLRAVISQRLLPRADGSGRSVLAEILICTPGVRELIADRNRVGEIVDYMEGAVSEGMQTFDQHLQQLVDQDVIAPDTAKGSATDPRAFEPRRRKVARS